MAAFRTLRFYHHAMQEVAHKHGLSVKGSHESLDASGTTRYCTVLLPNRCPVGPYYTRSPEELDHFLSLIMPAFNPLTPTPMYHISDEDDFQHATEAELRADLKEAEQVLAKGRDYVPSSYEEGQEHEQHLAATQRRVDATLLELSRR